MDNFSCQFLGKTEAFRKNMNIDPLKYAEKLKEQRNAAQDQVALLSAVLEKLQSEIEELKSKEKS
jgi:thiamine kinase-like enzyme